jgi:hypothetical protein
MVQWRVPDIYQALLSERSLERAFAYVISVGIVSFGVWIFVAGLSSSAPAVWTCLALIPIAIGLLSTIYEC